MSILKVQRRDPAHQARKLRKQGILPMALVRRDHSTALIQVQEDELRRALKSIDGLGRLDLETEDGKMKAVIRNIEKDYNTHLLTHAVLQEVSEDDLVRMDVAVMSVGTPQAVADGQANLLQQTDHLKVRGKMSAMPDHIEVDVSHLELGSNVSAHEVALPEGITLQSSPDSVLFSVTALKEVSLTPETLEPANEEAASEEPASE